jgi:hypothetical protein
MCWFVFASFLSFILVCLVPVGLRVYVRRFLMCFATSLYSWDASRLPRTVITGRMYAHVDQRSFVPIKLLFSP